MYTTDTALEQNGLARPQNWGPWKSIIIAVSYIVILISSINIVGEPETHRGWQYGVSGICLFWCVTYFICAYQRFRTAYLFTHAYIALLVIFHLGSVIPYSFGFISDVQWSSGPFSKWVERAGWYTALSLGAYGVGFGSSLNRWRFDVQAQPINDAVKRNSLGLAFWMGLGLLIASAIFLALAINSLGDLLSYSRVDFFRGAGDTRGLGVFLMVFPSAIVLLVVGADSRAKKYFSYILAALSFFIILLSGYRSAALFSLLIGAILWVKTGKRIPLPLASIAILVVLVAIPAISLIRSLGPYENLRLNLITESFKEAKIQSTFLELGQTIGILGHILRFIPKDEPYRYGSSYLKAMSNVVPNISTQIRASDRRSVSQQSLRKTKLLAKLTPANWLTYKLSPLKFKQGEGVGFSAIGEAYMNFGFFGVVLFFGILGYLLGRLDIVNLINYPKLIIFSGALLWPLIRTVRNDMGTFTKPFVFTLITLLIWHYSTKLFTKHRYESRQLCGE